MIKTYLSTFLILLVVTCSQHVVSQNDTIKTAFRKGRWLTGFSGTISSTNTRINNNDFKTTSNNYGINIESGKFVKDRFLIGGLLQVNRISSEGNFDKTTETFYLGPFANYYFMDGLTGSLYARLSMGYVRYKDETEFNTEDLIIQEFSEGGGFGSIFGVGYSYTMNDFVAFDLGINVNVFWVTVDQETQPSQTIVNSNVNSSDISFSFGFNIILDDFFF